MEYLRPCPFCGGDAILEDLGGAGTAGRYFVRCPKCKVAQDTLWVTKKTALKRWNRRFPADGTGQHGKWEFDPGAMFCSRCGWMFSYEAGLEDEWNYCPHCRAPMGRSEE